MYRSRCRSHHKYSDTQSIRKSEIGTPTGTPSRGTRVQDYTVQYCVTKSLSFTTATMTLDCVSTAVITLIRQKFTPTC